MSAEWKKLNEEVGLCTDCGKNTPRRGRKTCIQCALVQSIRNRISYLKRKEKQNEPRCGR